MGQEHGAALWGKPDPVPDPVPLNVLQNKSMTTFTLSRRGRVLCVLSFTPLSPELRVVLL